MQILCSDIEDKYNTIDPNKLEDLIKKNIKKNRKIRAIIAVDYGGMLYDWSVLKFISNKYNIILINDNCHALGSRYNNNKSYALNYAHIVSSKSSLQKKYYHWRRWCGFDKY